MIFNLKYIATDPADGQIRKIDRFAWFPVIIGSKAIWFGKYHVLQVFVVTNYLVTLKEKTKETAEVKQGFKVGKWINLSKGLIE